MIDIKEKRAIFINENASKLGLTDVSNTNNKSILL